MIRWTAPGGWVEFQDWDIHLYSEDGSTKGTSIEQYHNAVIKGFTNAGYVISPGLRLEEWFREAGFQDIHIQKYRIPVGSWPKDKYHVCDCSLEINDRR